MCNGLQAIRTEVRRGRKRVAVAANLALLAAARGREFLQYPSSREEGGLSCLIVSTRYGNGLLVRKSRCSFGLACLPGRHIRQNPLPPCWSWCHPTLIDETGMKADVRVKGSAANNLPACISKRSKDDRTMGGPPVNRVRW
jgi:hypothetical protein